MPARLFRDLSQSSINIGYNAHDALRTLVKGGDSQLYSRCELVSGMARARARAGDRKRKVNTHSSGSPLLGLVLGLILTGARPRGSRRWLLKAAQGSEAIRR